jgi:hypothetical protein
VAPQPAILAGDSSVEANAIPRSPPLHAANGRLTQATVGAPTGAETREAATTAPDARLIERVAEDVIRRVDKRLRIERERRGI